MFYLSLANQKYPCSNNQIMIQKILETLCNDLNGFLKQRYATEEDKVVLSPLVDEAGHPILGRNKILCTLLNTQQIVSPVSSRTKEVVLKNPPLTLELHLQFAASFPSQNYAEALEMLTLTMGFFHGKAVFNPQNTPDLPIALDQVTMSILELDPNTMSQLWQAQGVPLQPALHYRCRLTSVAEDKILGEVPAIEGVAQLKEGEI